jgi:hypothetical protein
MAALWTCRRRYIRNEMGCFSATDKHAAFESAIVHTREDRPNTCNRQLTFSGFYTRRDRSFRSLSKGNQTKPHRSGLVRFEESQKKAALSEGQNPLGKRERVLEVACSDVFFLCSTSSMKRLRDVLCREIKQREQLRKLSTRKHSYLYSNGRAKRTSR